MSKIAINEENFSKFSKRLKKSLQEKGIEIPLNEAQILLSKTFGFDSVYNFQKELKKEKIEEKEEAIQIKDFIEAYFKNNIETKIKSFSFFKDSDQTVSNCFSIVGETIKKEDQEGFGLYFSWKITEEQIDDMIRNLDLTEKDKEFIKILVEKMETQNRPKNAYINLRLEEIFELSNKKEGVYSFFENSKMVFEPVNNYGYCRKAYALVDEDFFERNGAPYVLNGEDYCFIDLKNEKNVVLFDDPITALKELDKKEIKKMNKMVIEFLTPKNQYSNLVQKSEFNKQGICSWFCFIDVNTNVQKILRSSSFLISKPMEKESDFHYFLGKLHAQKDHSFNKYKIEYVMPRIPVNSSFRNDFLNGLKDFLEEKEEKNLKQKTIKSK